MTDTTLPGTQGEAPQVTVENGRIADINALQRVGLHAKTRKALEDMAHEGLTARQAAERQKLPVETVNRAFDRRHVKIAFKQVLAAIRDNAAQAAYMRINHMSQTAQGERIKLDANRWIAGVDGISPVTKVEGKHQHSHTFAGFDYGDTVDVTPDEPEPDTDE